MYGHQKGHGVTHFVCGLRYKLDSQGISSVAGVSQLALFWVLIRNKELVLGERSFIYIYIYCIINSSFERVNSSNTWEQP
jgi:hypothetical protein